MFKFDQRQSIIHSPILRSTSRPTHPYSKFGTGNIDTLKATPESNGLNVRDELIKFHERFYSANLMNLCVLGNESLDQLNDYVLQMFSAIPNKNLTKKEFDSNPYVEKEHVDVMHVIPVQEKRGLFISWVIPDSKTLYKSYPSNYISHLIGHESEGSLFSKLKSNSWCNSISAGAKGTFYLIVINFNV